MPPDIVSAESSSDVSLAEDETAKLTCTARGYPSPNITWRREDYEPIFVRGDYRNRQKGERTTAPSATSDAPDGDSVCWYIQTFQGITTGSKRTMYLLYHVKIPRMIPSW